MQIIDFDFADPCIWVSIFSSCGPFLVPFLKNCGPFLVPFLKNCGPFLVPFRDFFLQGPKLSPLLHGIPHARHWGLGHPTLTPGLRSFCPPDGWRERSPGMGEQGSVMGLAKPVLSGFSQKMFSCIDINIYVDTVVHSGPACWFA